MELSREDRRRARTTSERAYYAGFVVVLLVCFSPFKPLAYFMPAFFTGYMLVSAPQVGDRNRLAVLLAVACAVASFYALVAPEFLYGNYGLALITYSSFVPLLVLDGRRLGSPALLERLLNLVGVVIGVEGVLGIAQAAYGSIQSGYFSGSNGDRVTGTIYPYFSPEGLGANPMFAINVSFMLLACSALPETIRGGRRHQLLAGTIALVLASVMHVLVYLVVSLLVAYWLTRAPRVVTAKTRTTARAILSLVVVVGVVSYVALPENVDQIANVMTEAVNVESVTPRMVLLLEVASDLPDDQPMQPLVGLGPGQFSSRASLMASGLFLGGPSSPKPVPFLGAQSTRLAEDYCFTLFRSYATEESFIGSSQQPFFSYLSVYTELGITAIVALVVFVMKLLRRVQRAARDRPQVRVQALVVTSGSIFLLLLGLQENYWEMPQAILVGVLLLKVVYANVMYPEADEVTGTS